MNNFIQRTLTGIVFVVAMVASIIIHPVAFAIVLLAVTILGQLEFYRLLRSGEVLPDRVTGITGGVLVYVLVFLFSSQFIRSEILLLAWVVIPLVFISGLFSRHEKPIANISYTLLGVIYVVLPFSLLNLLYLPDGSAPPGYQLLLGYFVILWLYDTGAYLFGKAAGRHPLFKRISPKKTWEGLAGGFVIAILAAWGLSRFFLHMTLNEWILMAVIIVVFSTFGDLTESMLKRTVQVKDSGTLLPGHGGILDRFDGVLLSAPAVYLYLYFFIK